MIDVAGNFFEFIPLLGGEHDSLFARQHFAVFLVVLPDVDVGFAVELRDCDSLLGSQGPEGGASVTLLLDRLVEQLVGVF